MKLIGLTGNSGSGKSAVCRLFVEKGGLIIDADKVARLVVEVGKPVYNELVAFFGAAILNIDRTINRHKLADIAFASDYTHKALTRITHKHITAHIQGQIQAVKANPRAATCIVLDAPLLIEANMHTDMDEVWVVTAPRELKVARIMARDGLTTAQACARLDKQSTEDVLLRYATHHLHNDGDLGQLLVAFEGVWAQ